MVASVLKRSTSVLRKNLLYWRYLFLGPTTAYLRHEYFLLLSLTCLTLASMQGVYRTSLGTLGDLLFVLFAALWLGRHLLLKWLCCRDRSSSRTPTLSGLLVIWLTSHFYAGQYWDRPNPPVVARHIGTSHTDEARIVATLPSFFPPSLLAVWQLIRVRVIFPLLTLHENSWKIVRFGGKSSRGGNTTSSTRRAHVSSRRTTVSLGINQAYSYWNNFWSVYGIPLQFVIPLFALSIYAWHYSTYFADAEITYALTMNTRSLEEDMAALEAQRPHGGYRKLPKPTLTHLWFQLSVWSVLATAFLYGRVLLPFPDLVAGSNVLKAVRNEARATTNQSTKSKAKSQRENADVPWAEQAKSIVSENRFRLFCKVAFVRMVEAVIVCLLLPRTSFICRFTSHCPDGVSIRALSKIFFPVGISTTVRSDPFYPTESTYMVTDRGAAFMCVVSVIVTTLSLLLAQAATTNRSYLGIMGYIAGGWTVVDSADPSLAGAAPSPWDPRRRYKKGDLIVQSYPGFATTIYKATSNSPEGRPLDLYLRATHDLFRNELGHPASSNVIAYTAGMLLVLAMMTMILIMGYQFRGYGYGSLLWTLTANLVASYGILSTARPNYVELDGIAQEIAVSKPRTS